MAAQDGVWQHSGPTHPCIPPTQVPPGVPTPILKCSCCSTEHCGSQCALPFSFSLRRALRYLRYSHFGRQCTVFLAIPLLCLVLRLCRHALKQSCPSGSLQATCSPREGLNKRPRGSSPVATLYITTAVAVAKVSGLPAPAPGGRAEQWEGLGASAVYAAGERAGLLLLTQQ